MLSHQQCSHGERLSTPLPLGTSVTNVDNLTLNDSTPLPLGTSVTNADNVTSNESTPSLFTTSVNNVTSIECIPANEKLTLDQGFGLAQQRLLDSGFKVSPTQEQTPGDGNCAIHGLLDQMRYDPKLKNLAHVKSPHDIRSMVVQQLALLEATGKITWPGHMSMEDWTNYMMNNGAYCDEVYLLLAAEVFNREIVLVPVFQEEGHDENGFIKFTPSSFLSCQMFSPFYLLYYSEAKFVIPHFQSIRPTEGSQKLIASIPERSSLLSLPQMESTNATSEASRKRKQNSREMSYLSDSNIVSGKRCRKK